MNEVTSADKLGLFTVGMGAVATTLFAGVELARRHGRTPVGSYTQLGWLTDAAGRPDAWWSACRWPPSRRWNLAGST
jgi:hypothetical protein